jgi:subtilisin family serine protease
MTATPDEYRRIDGATGRGVRIAIIDSGVNPGNPHVGGVVAAAVATEAGVVEDPAVDRLGHGTAVLAAVHDIAPDAELLVVKIFERTLAAPAQALLKAIDWSARNGAALVNLSLGVANAAQAGAMRDAVERAADRGTVIVSPRAHEGAAWLPGSLPGVIAVEVDWACPRHAYGVRASADGGRVFLASGFAREIPGVAPERNLKGVSFAAANMTGHAARAGEWLPRWSFDALTQRLCGASPLPRL